MTQFFEHYHFRDFRQDFSSLKNNQFLIAKVSLKYNSLELTPFIDINQKKEECDDFVAIKWWQDHNSIKHDRDMNFQYATLENFITALYSSKTLNQFLYDFANVDLRSTLHDLKSTSAIHRGFCFIIKS